MTCAIIQHGWNATGKLDFCGEMGYNTGAHYVHRASNITADLLDFSNGENQADGLAQYQVRDWKAVYQDTIVVAVTRAY